MALQTPSKSSDGYNSLKGLLVLDLLPNQPSVKTIVYIPDSKTNDGGEKRRRRGIYSHSGQSSRERIHVYP